MNYQRTAQQVGIQGCLFLATCYNLNIIDEWPKWYKIALGKRIIDADCYSFNAVKFIGLVMGGIWEQVEVAFDYLTPIAEYDILMYEAKKKDEKGNPITHYVSGDRKGGVLFDPWEGSLSVKDGTKAKRYTYRRKV